MSGGTTREIVSALVAENSRQGNVLISLDIEDDKLFLLHFIIGTYFGPDLRNHHHPKKQSAFQLQAASSPITSDDLSGSIMKRAELERVYHYIIRNADPSLIVKTGILRQYFNAKRNDSNRGFPLFRDLYPLALHPETRLRNQYKLIQSILFISDPDTSCMRQNCIKRFRRLTGMQSFTLSLSIDLTETNSIVVANEVEHGIVENMEPSKEDTCLEFPVTFAGNDKAGTRTSSEESDVAAKPGFGVNGPIAGTQAGPVVGLMDIGECTDAYLFRVSLPGVKRDERDFSCEVEDNGKVLVRGVTTTGEKRVHRYSQVFDMQTQNLCPAGHFSVSFHLPGPVHPQEFSGSFGTDGILEGIVMKKLQKQTV
ncbi:unnamed protein product [Arabis nemorensis]|uniref:SHSP domain-containing protein n=1 Tax=Arabis nemorensis TaxID=586526 RepID=A0A565AX74_9BRAS|nr:unnamed protein product [Arabis nemorensis]